MPPEADMYPDWQPTPRDEQSLELWLDWYGRERLAEEQQAFENAF